MGGGLSCHNFPFCNINTIITEKSEKIQNSIDTTTFNSLMSIIKNKEQNINFYEFSKDAWEYLNEIRINPLKYSQLLKYALNTIEEEKKYLNQNLNNYLNKKEFQLDKNKKVEIFLIIHLLKHKDMFSIFNELSEKLERIESSKKDIIRENNSNLLSNTISNDNFIDKRNKIKIEWDKKLYDAIEEAYKIKSNIEEINDEEINYQNIFSKLLKKRIKVIKYEENDYSTPEIIVWKLLIENIEKIYDILYDNYFCGVVYSFPKKNGIEEYINSSFYFIYKLPINNIVINGYNPYSGNYLPLKLSEPFFKDIDYKDKIIGGNYYYNENGINVQFELFNGERKEENIDFQNNIIIT